jgi:sulfur relay protein TusD/DsrE
VLNVRLCVVIGSGPWGSSRTTTALRFVRAAHAAGHRTTVFFRDDGVYNAIAGSVSDGGLESPQSAWATLATEQGTDLLLCPAATARRMAPSMVESLPACWRQAGLASLLEIMSASDRVLHF